MTQNIQPRMFEIRTRKLLIRSYEESDAQAIAIAVKESAPSVNPWLPWCTSDYTESDARHWIHLTAEDRNTGSAYEFGVFSSDNKRFFGGVGLNKIDRKDRVCNMGYWVRESEQRKGIALECVKALSGYAFSMLHLRRVEIIVAFGNEASAGVARKAGAQFEGIARNRLFIHDKSVPAYIFSLVPAQVEKINIR